jgi:hypothetical protein
MALPFKSDSIVIPSGGAADPRVVTGTADPTSGFAAPEGSIYLRYVASNGQAFVKSGVGDTDWTNLVTAGGTTLDGSYDFGGPGVGRIIVADSGALQVNATTADTQAALVLNRSPTGSSAAVGLELTLGANANTSSSGVQINDSGTGTSLYTTKLAAGIAHYTSLQHAGAQALVVAVNAAPSSASPVSILANTDGTTATLLSITKIPSSSTAGAGIGISMGANTTGPAITVSAAGTGPALQVSAGSIEMANSAAAVSPANNGRIRYNSGTQTFQVSLNGAAYVDVATGAGTAIGSPVTSGTVGSVLFVGAGGVLQQDNTNFNWNDTNNALTVITTTASPAVAARNSDAGAGAMSIQNTNASGPVDFYAVDSTGTARISWGFGNASYSDSSRAGRGYLWRNSGINFVFARTSTVDAFLDSSGRLGIGTSTSLDTSSLLHVNSGSSGVGNANTGSLIVIERSANVYLTIKSPNASDKGILFANPTSNVDGGIIYDNTGTARGLQLRTAGNTSRLAITSVGDVVIGNAAAAPTKSAFIGPLEVTGDARSVNITVSTYGTGFNSELMLYRGRGTGASTTAVQTGDLLGQVAFTGATTATGFFSGVLLRSLTTENWSGTNTGSKFELYTTATGGTSRLLRLTVEADGGLTLSNSSSAAVSAAGEVRLRNSSNRLQVSENGGGYLTVASHASGVITGGVFFGNGSDRIAQDAPNFFWDDTNNRLFIGTNTEVAANRPLQVSSAVASAVVAIRNTNAAGFPVINFYDEASTSRVGIGYNNASDIAVFDMIDSGPLAFQGGGTTRATLGVGAGEVYWQLTNGGSAAVGAADTARLRYNDSTSKLQVSLDGAAYVDLATGTITPTVERLNADGAASPTVDTTFVSGTGTDLTLANGTVDGFIKNFVVTGGNGTVTPTNLADGDVLTWTANPANVQLIWDATGTTWHVYGTPFNVTVS